MYFPTPYPDELIGSVIARACVHLGLAPKQLIQLVLGRRDGHMPFFLSSDLGPLSSLTRVSPEQLAMGHTVLPYVTAFLSPPQAKVIHHRTIQSSGGRAELTALTKLVTQGSRLFKVCPLCVQQDIATYGESYWRRSHSLPGVYLCCEHDSPLLEVTNLGTRRTYKAMGAGNPSLLWASNVTDLPDFKLLKEISSLSIKTLSADWNHRPDWWLQYRDLAISKGYGKIEKYPTGSLLSKDIGAVFAEPFLQRVACSLNTRPCTSWPSLMLKPGTGVPFSPLKHILLATFLATCAERGRAFNEGKSTKSSDISVFDITGSQRVRSVWAHAAEHQARLSVTSLLTAAGVWSKFRNNRNKCPAIADAVREFRRSEQANFRLGKSE